MVSIKVHCGCGQKYAFDTEPVQGRMNSAVACPVCGADGTSAANAALAQSLAAAPAQRAAPPPASAETQPASGTNSSALRVTGQAQTGSGRAHSRHVSALNLPQMDRTQAQHEARAKISWGDAPEEVVKFLMLHGFNVAEARALVDEMFQERAATIRKNGIGKIIMGIGAVCVPVIATLIFLSIGMFLLKIYAVTIMVGLWGLWLILKGSIMALSPKSEQGDVAEQ